MSNAHTPEPPPKRGTAPILALVLADLAARAAVGHRKYGTYLEAGNGRDGLTDLYQELLDACMYARQELEERGTQYTRLGEVFDVPIYVGPCDDETRKKIDDFLMRLNP